MPVNTVKQALRAGRRQIGTGIFQLRSPELARVLAGAGFDWAFYDTEHGGFGIESLQDFCRVANLVGIPPIVRVAEMHYSLVARALDCGAGGIIFPRVESPQLLAEAVSWTRFPNEGVRGFGLGLTQLGYKPSSFAEAMQEANENTLVVLQIETVKAFEARDELLSVPGIDAVLIGPADLSVSMGIPGEFQNSRLIETVDLITQSCLEHGVAPGIHVRSLDLAAFWKDRGMLLLSCGNEISLLFERACEVCKRLQ